MASNSLPSVDSPDVYLAVATPEELRRQWRYNSAEWQGPFDLETYVRREELLLEQSLTRSGGLVGWILVHQPGRKGPRMILCGCETVNKKAIVAKLGHVAEVSCNGVASVFCPAEHRGKGYAGRMMSELARVLADGKALEQQGLQKVLFSVLWSDIGKDFYASRGWQVFPSAHISLKPSKQPSIQHLPTVKLLTSTQIPDLCAEDRASLMSSLSRLKSTKTTVALEADARIFEWHHARSDFYAKELLHREITNRGAIVELTPGGERAWCIWQHIWSKTEPDKDNKLYILHLVVPGGENTDFTPATEQGVSGAQNTPTTKAVAALFAAAQAEAADWGLSSVECWNPSSISLAAAQLIDADVSVQHRSSSSIASLLWLGEGSAKDIDWVCNERYGWN